MSMLGIERTDIGQMSNRALSTIVPTGKNLNVCQPSFLTEDDSSLSSASPEVFDRSLSGPLIKENLPRNKRGDWRRYDSFESAPSTAISSICSSVAAEDGTSDTSATTISRKRMSDGSLKLSPLGSPTVLSPTGAFQIRVEDEGSQLKKSKKRGRTTKVKHTNSKKPLRSVKTSSSSKLDVEIIEVRPRSSIPNRIPATVFASQCIESAYASRLDPYSLHTGENRLLFNLLTSKEVTVYLNIRNAILRLWRQNPLCTVTLEEAEGCAKDRRFFGLAEAAHKWLTRNGYINFGCVEILQGIQLPTRTVTSWTQRTVVVIGAGVSGLTTARQLENLFKQDASIWTNAGERPPRVVIIEGRKRIGGRVYSKPLRSQVKDSLPNDLRNTAEMGAMIVTGFEHGNPLDTVIRGQLGLRYHMMTDKLTIYDCDGRAVDENRDMLTTQLYTDITDRAGVYRAAAQKPETLRGDEDLINRCRDPTSDGLSTFQLEPLPTDHIRAHNPSARRGRRRNAPPGTEKLTGRSQVIEGVSGTLSACRAVKDMGWTIRDGVARNQTISLTRIAGATEHPTLGSVMDEAISQYQDLIDLTPQDMRLLNWHHANLEYANAAPISSLSLTGHDQDTGNEFEGAHSEVVGGYTQVPRGLVDLPTKLDVRFDKTVESIHYDSSAAPDGGISTKVVCADGEVIEADQVVVTAPLGVLKSSMIDFDPPLPHWKRGAIDRMGFGLLNKVILLYDSPFWDDERDMFGLLNEAEHKASLNPTDYEQRRGRFYLIWNASKISGRPLLVALMAGKAAYDAENTDTQTLLSEVTGRLRGVFGPKVPAPLEVIVTRWKQDPFTRGTYSYVGPQTRPGDYDLMAQPFGNLHFAGEATCGTHPATVHGAFLSGLRVASEVMDYMAGQITLRHPLVEPSMVKSEAAIACVSSSTTDIPIASTSKLANNSGNDGQATQTSTIVIKQEPDSQEGIQIPDDVIPVMSKPPAPPAKSVCASDASFWVSTSPAGANTNHEAIIMALTVSQIGERPIKPARPGVNPFLLFTKAKWDECKASCSQEHSPSGRDMVRQTLGKWWKAAGNDVKQPYIKQSQSAQQSAGVARKEWESRSKEWDKEASRIRGEYIREHPEVAAALRKIKMEPNYK